VACGAIVLSAVRSKTGFINRYKVAFDDLLSLAGPQKYQSCTNIFTKIKKGVEKLALKPPVPVVNPYVACRKTWPTAFAYSVGSAIASAQSLVLLICLIVGYAIIFRLKRNFKTSIIVNKDRKKTIEETLQTLRNDSLVSLLEQLTHITENESKRPFDSIDNDELIRRFKHFQRLHTIQQSDEDFALVGRELSAALNGTTMQSEMSSIHPITTMQSEMSNIHPRAEGGVEATVDNLAQRDNYKTRKEISIQMIKNPMALDESLSNSKFATI
jgi:hypothetical protein